MAAPSLHPQSCSFGPFVLDPTNRRLLRDGVAVPITARVFDILAALLQHAGEPVDKDTLVELVWGDTIVEEGNLARNVSTLRRLLGEHPDDHRYIVTLPGRGYQFVAEVRPVIEALANAALEAAPGMAVPPGLAISPVGDPGSAPLRSMGRLIWSVAALLVLGIAGAWMAFREPSDAAPENPSRLVVLPFKNLGAADDEYFSLGMTEEITTRLTSVPDLRVISRTSGDRYERSDRTVSQIGAELGVDYLLEGSVRWDHRESGQLRVVAQLIRVSDDSHLWSATYDRRLDDVFEVQSDIGRRVVVELRGALAPERAAAMDRPPTKNIEAYQAYVRGLFFANLPDPSEGHFLRVIAQFQRAVELDPDFALAYASLARAHEAVIRFAYDTSNERKAMAARALARAEALAPDSPAVLLARGRYASTVDNDLEGALRAAEAAERLRPHDAAVLAVVANSRLMTGRWTEAAATYERALQLDPRNAAPHATLGLIYTAQRRHADAQLAIDRSIELEPDQVLANVLRVWNTWLWRGDIGGARAQLDRLARHDDWRFMELGFLQGLYERRFDVARNALPPFAGQWMRDWVLTRPVVLFEAQALRFEGDFTRSLAAFGQARDLLEAEARRAPADGRIRSSLAIALAGLGDKIGARREGRKALELMPYPEGFDTATVREDVALALTMIGDHDAAVAELEKVLGGPAYFSVHLLRLDPRWDLLRSHPRYPTLAGLTAPVP